MTQYSNVIDIRPTCPWFVVGHEPADPGESRRRSGERDEILGIVSHELRNALSAINYWSAALLHDPPRARVTQNASNILASVRRMHGIIHDMLDIGRLLGGDELALERAPSDAHELCAQAVAELQAGRPHGQIRLRSVGDASGRWDTRRLSQMVSNLISNALQYGDPGAPVTVESRAGDNHWELSVHNLGAPISAALMPRLFDAYVRGRDATRLAGANHLGIGLFIVRQIVIAHGGTIAVSSSLDTGTCFVARLPRRSLGLAPRDSDDT
ncbi:MAG: HAMP domain-containing sensor histidine kinase [Polyangiaceae bacterium]